MTDRLTAEELKTRVKIVFGEEVPAVVKALLAELQRVTEHLQLAKMREANCNALISKIQDIVENAFPDQRRSDFDVLDQGVGKLAQDLARVTEERDALRQDYEVELSRAEQWKEEAHRYLNVVEAFQKFAPDCAQLLDGWHADGTAWSEWDETVRQELSRLMIATEEVVTGKPTTARVWTSPSAAPVEQPPSRNEIRREDGTVGRLLENGKIAALPAPPQ